MRLFIFLITVKLTLLPLGRNACEHKLKSYGDHKPRYYGYTSYGEAEEAWEFYLETGIVPNRPANGGVAATLVPTTPHRNRNRTFQGVTDSHPRGYTPSPLSDTQSPTFSQRTLSTQPEQTEAAESSFFVVFAGYNPGVYTSR